MQPTQRAVTAGSMDGRINFDGRSPTSSAFLGGSGYMGQCWTCGLEPGSASKCICCCKVCCCFTNGRGNEERVCCKCSGVPWVAPVLIGTVHVKVKRKRSVAAPTVVSSLLAVSLLSHDDAAAAIIVISSSESPSPNVACDGSSPQPPPQWLKRYMAASGAAQLRCPTGIEHPNPFSCLDDAMPFTGRDVVSKVADPVAGLPE